MTDRVAPWLALAVAAVVGLSAEHGAAQTAAADSALATPPASTLPTVLPTLSEAPTPRGALVRSAVLPGWGQLRNGKPVKAVLFAAAAGALLTAAVADAASVGDFDDLERRESRVARRNSRFLFFFIATTLCGLDAFVDAHLADFGPEPSIGPTGSVGLRLTWTPF